MALWTLRYTDFNFAIPDLVSKVVYLILRDFDATPVEAMDALYASPTYEMLEKDATGYSQLTVEELYNDFLVSTERNEML